MKLADLFLDRFLYRDNKQSSETQDSAFVSADSSEPVAPSIASGGAAQDINQGNVEIDGNIIEEGTLPTTDLDLANWGWGQTCVFTSSDHNTVAWGLGTFTSAGGDEYILVNGSTGNMTGKTYIYLDINVSPTSYQYTTVSANAVGANKVLIAVADIAVSPDLATFNMSEATQIVGDNILANTIDASKMTTGVLVIGTGVAIGTAFASADAGDLAVLDLVGEAELDTTVIVGGYIKTSLLTANNIVTGNLTGIVIQTSSSANTGVKMSSALGGIVVYGQTMSVRTTGGTYIGAIGHAYTGLAITSTSGSDIVLDPGGDIVFRDDALPVTTNAVNLGSPTKVWGNIYTSNVDFATSRYLNYTGGYIQSNGQFRVVGSIKLTGNLTFENAASITINGRVYYETTGAYDSSKYYLRSS